MVLLVGIHNVFSIHTNYQCCKVKTLKQTSDRYEHGTENKSQKWFVEIIFNLRGKSMFTRAMGNGRKHRYIRLQVNKRGMTLSTVRTKL